MADLKVKCGYVHLKGPPRLVEFGLPLKKGTIYEHDTALYFTVNGVKISKSEAVVISRWPCGSIKWIHVRLLCSYEGSIELCYSSELTSGALSFLSQKQEEWSAINLNTKNVFNFSSVSLNEVNENEDSSERIKTVSLTPESLDFYPTIVLKDRTALEHFKLSSAQIKSSDLLSQIEVRYGLMSKENLLNVTIIANYCSFSREMNVNVRIHNANAALHRNNTWDLGDENSVYLDDFSINFETTLRSIKLLLQENKDQFETIGQSFFENAFRLEQSGSGGKNWQSPIHWNENKQSTVTRNGFVLYANNEIQKKGNRCSPLVCYYDNKQHVTFELEDFWQNFPITIECSDKRTKYKLLDRLTELQGGESKTWDFIIRCGKLETHINSTLTAISKSYLRIEFLSSYIDSIGVIPNLNFSNNENSLGLLINKGIHDNNNFFEKREQIDAFGWRNFGDLYADHEVPNNFSGQYFVSHYNNQYDPLYGMMLQYLKKSDKKWLFLIKPLSKHLQDIDIYDTELDKCEYNGGLMWHTDHYLPAETCTHRSNSKHHSYAYDGFLGGGGPGGQHCYTTGLLWQYLFFSDTKAKDKVLQLTNWIRRFYNGGGSLIERTFRFLTIDLKNQQLTMIGQTFNGYRYPLDRGTGNFLTALIDSYEATSDEKLIEEIGFVIRNTVHPEDDLLARDLKNVEEFWFYTVFFQAVVKYLFLKEAIQQIDDDYYFARQTFMHYANWMLVNEDYYLNNPSILEFPNDTWCAQDVRKANLLYYAYYFGEVRNERFIQRADEFYSYIKTHLQCSSENQHTRILAILMQNDGVFQMFNYYENNQRILPFSNIEYKTLAHASPPKFSVAKMLIRYLKDIIKLLPNFSVKNEWQWLKFRINKIL